MTTLRASIAGSANPMPLVNVGMAGAPNASVTTFINMALQAAGLGSKVAPASKPVSVPLTQGSTCNMTCANYCKVSSRQPAMCGAATRCIRLRLFAMLCGLRRMQQCLCTVLRFRPMDASCTRLRALSTSTHCHAGSEHGPNPPRSLSLTPFPAYLLQKAPLSAPKSSDDQMFLLAAFIFEDVMVTMYEGDIGQLADSLAGLGLQVSPVPPHETLFSIQRRTLMRADCNPPMPGLACAPGDPAAVSILSLQRASAVVESWR